MVPVFDPEVPVLDVAVMAAIRSLGDPGEPDVFTELARLFLADVPTRLWALRAAIAAESAAAVAQIAHQLRGGALEMGALRMVPLCKAIEDAAHARSLEQAAVRADSLDREFAVVREALEREIQ